MVPLPSLAEVEALDLALTGVVDGPHVDPLYDHLTVAGHLALHVTGSETLIDRLGIDPRGHSGPRTALMDLEHHLRYLAEVEGGARFAIHERLLDRAPRRLHGVRFLVDLTNQRLADTFEFVSVHVDLDARRATPFPPAVAERLDALVGAGRAVPWPAPRCGALGLTRST